MDRYAAFLRGVNVGGNRKIAMAALREFAEEIGMREPKTLLQSGNLVFGSELDAAELERLLEKEASTRLSLDTTILVRSRDELQGIVKGNPFPREAKSDPSHLLVHFSRDVVDRAAASKVQLKVAGPEKIEARGREVFVIYPDGIGQSKLDRTLGWKSLMSESTARNWNTVLKVLDAL